MIIHRRLCLSREAPLEVHVGQSFWIVIKSLICNCRINETYIKTNRGIEREYCH